ncbi:MAG TPA: YgeY family selenium metabolism-linked hydrolase [Chloroflexota bacterium]|nr:YgeY family selenium metabolism-linked hydrolase [Chloroflexota bacterium]
MEQDQRVLADIGAEVDRSGQEIAEFLHDLVRIPSYDSQIGEVGGAIAERMRELDFDEVRFDDMGNVLGRVGTGPITVLLDSHIDTVGLGDLSQWGWDPLQGKIEDGVLFARGACDEKGSTPPMVYAAAILKRLGLLEGITVYYFGNMEEWCDGIAPHALVEHEGIRPDFVVIGEPTKMGIYRGHRGRIELTATFRGRSSHAAMPQLGVNPLYPAARFLEGMEDLGGRLPSDPFLGQGTVVPSSVRVITPSLNAVPDECEIYIDRRVIVGDTPESVTAELRTLPEGQEAEIEVPTWNEPSYTGFVFPVPKIFPAWSLPESHPLVQRAVDVYRTVFREQPRIGKWDFSTNGIYWAGKAGIPAIGFGPGDERFAHTTLDQVPLQDVVDSTRFYAGLALSLAGSQTRE